MNSTEIDKKSLIAFREGIEADLPLIYASWLKGLYYGNTLFADVSADVYYAIYHQVIEAILKKPGVMIKVACLKDDPDVILGYSVLEGNTLHWVFVKSAWRDIGLGADLIPSALVTFTHLTKVGRAIWKKKYPGAFFNPFLMEK